MNQFVGACHGILLYVDDFINGNPKIPTDADGTVRFDDRYYRSSTLRSHIDTLYDTRVEQSLKFVVDFGEKCVRDRTRFVKTK